MTQHTPCGAVHVRVGPHGVVALPLSWTVLPPSPPAPSWTDESPVPSPPSVSWGLPWVAPPQAAASAAPTERMENVGLWFISYLQAARAVGR
jgi:hypothetical protein